MISLTLFLIAALFPVDSQLPEVIRLPPLEINGKSARVHTQGLEIVGDLYYVTGRREDVTPKRALLLRTDGTRWQVWDITPDAATDGASILDHPGGMQSDGRCLWIPVAQSVRHGRSVIQVIPMDRLVFGQPAHAKFEWQVTDHIGAVAVSTNQQLVLGANWDTESIYVWNLNGELQRTLRRPELEPRGLGAVSAPATSDGVAVQDWKFIGPGLFASGLVRGTSFSSLDPKSRLFIFNRFQDSSFERQTVRLPVLQKTELAREAMAVHGGFVYFLPEDLGSTNRLFRIRLNESLWK